MKLKELTGKQFMDFLCFCDELPDLCVEEILKLFKDYKNLGISVYRFLSLKDKKGGTSLKEALHECYYIPWDVNVGLYRHED